MNLFRRARTAPELVAKCCAAFEALSRDAGSQVALDHVAKYVGEMKVILFGEAGEKAPKEEEGRVLAVEAAKTPLLTHLCSHLAPLGFEARRPPPPAAARRVAHRRAPRRRRARRWRRCSAASFASLWTAARPASPTLSRTRSWWCSSPKGAASPRAAAARRGAAARGALGRGAAPAGAANRSRLAHSRPASSGWTRR